MRITYDRETNAAYLHRGDPAHTPGHSTTRAESPPGVNAFIALDWQNNRLVGIEILDADIVLPQALLEQADNPD